MKTAGYSKLVISRCWPTTTGHEDRCVMEGSGSIEDSYRKKSIYSRSSNSRARARSVGVFTFKNDRASSAL